MSGQMGRRRVQFLFRFALGVETLQAAALERRRVNGPRLAAVRLGDERNQIVEILDAFAGAEINAEARAIDAGDRRAGRRRSGLAERRRRRTGC